MVLVGKHHCPPEDGELQRRLRRVVAVIAATYAGPPAAMRAPLRSCRFSCCANCHRAHAHAVPSSFEPALIFSRFSRTMTSLLLTKRCKHP